MDESFSKDRGERRSFFCTNKLWIELERQSKDCVSISTYVKQAILEKMIREEPEKKEFFYSLIE